MPDEELANALKLAADMDHGVCRHCGVGYFGTGPWHWDGCPMLTEPLAIVRELAERGPFLDVDDIDVCADCDTAEKVERPLSDPANHALSCLWRRSRELYPG